MFLPGLIRRCRFGLLSARGVPSLVRKLAALAESLDFQRTAQQGKLPQAGCAFEERVYFRHFYVLHPLASHAHDVVVGLHVAVIARNIVQERYLPSLTDFAKFVQDPMDRGQGNMRMPPAYRGADVVGARMVL